MQNFESPELSRKKKYDPLLKLNLPTELRSISEKMKPAGRQESQSRLIIDLKAVGKNYGTLCKKAKHVMPMIKANGYGTDALTLAKFYQLHEVPIIGVSHVSEAVFLRNHGIYIPIFVIHLSPNEAEAAIDFELDAAVDTKKLVEALSFYAKKKKKQGKIHLCVNTGMNRFGVPYDRALAFADQILKQPDLVFEGVMTHFAASSDPAFDEFSLQQISRFYQVVSQLKRPPRWIHAANSEACQRFDLPFCNLARVGLALLGFGKGMCPALELNAKIVSIISIKKGETVGYERTWRAEKENTRVGVIPVGYYDGLRRQLSNKGYVLVHSKPAFMIGNVCMDFTMLDLTEIPEAKILDTAVIFNSTCLKAETLASWAATDIREILACLGPRIERTFIRERLYEKSRRNPQNPDQTLEKNPDSREHFAAS